MASLVILQTGSTIPSLRDRRGDFSDWFLTAFRSEGSDPLVVHAVKREPLPPWEDVTGIVVTGSHAMVTEELPWSEAAAALLRDAVSREIPVLGVCYGHQLLAHALGGVVGFHPQGREFGSVPIHLTAAAVSDPLLGGFPSPFLGYACHAQSVLRLPEGARILGHNAHDPHQAFAVGPRAWGLQFHPEFDADIMRSYIRECAAALQSEGQDPEALGAACVETPVGTEILKRFAALAGGFQP